MKVRHIVSTFLIMVLFFGSGFYAHARLFSNSTDGGFDDDPNTPQTVGAYPTASLTIRELIIKGAGAFFKAQGDINSLSEKVELSGLDGVDWAAIQEAVNVALENMYNARHYYRELEIKANQTPYNFNVFLKLIYFHYDCFQYQNGLIKDVFNEVEGYLSRGDIRGAYSRISAYFDTLIYILETIKKDVDAETIPANAVMWDLNQVCAKVHMFGQYLARVFEAL